MDHYPVTGREWRRRKPGVRIEREIRKEREILSPEAMAVLRELGSKVDNLSLRCAALESKIKAQDEMIRALQDAVTDRMVDALRAMRLALESQTPEAVHVAR